jgi:hypothetical protein
VDAMPAAVSNISATVMMQTIRTILGPNSPLETAALNRHLRVKKPS